MDILKQGIGAARKLLERDSQKHYVEAKLPQHETLGAKKARAEALVKSREQLGYKFVSDEKLRVPISDLISPRHSKEQSTTNMGLELITLLDWLEGQAENRMAIIANLKVWQAISKLPNKSSILETVAGAVKATASKSGLTELASNLSPLAIFRKLGTPAKDDELADVEFAEFRSLSAYTNPFAVFDAPSICGKWMDDKIFAAQRLAGLNPMAIQGVNTEEGSDEGVNWTLLRAKLSSKIDDSCIACFGLDMGLDEAAKQKRLYVCDYEALSEIEIVTEAPGIKQDKLLAPIALYVKADDHPGLQLAAIQLDQAWDSEVMLAKDKRNPGMANNWLMAKMIIQASDVNYNQAINHLLETHLIEDGIAVATRRHFAENHPLFILLSIHFTALLTINKAGEKLLLAPTGMMQEILETGLDGALQLMSKRYETWHFDDLDFPERLRKRGVSDSDALTYFPYRDDGLLVWRVLGDYAEAYVKNYYDSEAEVAADYELQAWAAELSEKTPGFPSEIGTIAELVTVIHRILWTAGPQHAAVNFPQVDYFAFVPNMPTAFYANPPADFSNHTVTDEELLAFLPPASKTAGQMEVAFALSGYHHDELLDYYDELEPSASSICKKFYDRLQGDVTVEITRRNKQRETQEGLLPYPYFLPSNIPNSTSV